MGVGANEIRQLSVAVYDSWAYSSRHDWHDYSRYKSQCRHLKILTQAGVVAREQAGICVYYRIDNPILFGLCDLVYDSLVRQAQQQNQQLRGLEMLRSQVDRQ